MNRVCLSVVCTHARAAQELGLPLLPPSKAKNATFRRGANFAITGATALGMDFFEEHGLARAVWSSGSLHTQIGWFRDMKPSICSSPQGFHEFSSDGRPDILDALMACLTHDVCTRVR
jgi:hypothetical protein